jgi:hypothetical protein
MIKYIVTMTMSPEDLNVLLKGHEIAAGTKLMIERIGVESVFDLAEPSPPEDEPRTAADPPKRHRTSKIETVIRAALADEPRGIPYLKNEMERAELNPNSLGATLSRMRKNGEVDNRDGVWSLAAQ